MSVQMGYLQLAYKLGPNCTCMSVMLQQVQHRWKVRLLVDMSTVDTMVLQHYSRYSVGGMCTYLLVCAWWTLCLILQGSKGYMRGANMRVPTTSSTSLFLLKALCPQSCPTTKNCTALCLDTKKADLATIQEDQTMGPA